MRDDHLFPQHKPIHLHRRGLIAPIVASLKNHSSNTHLQNQISKVINCSFRIGPKRQTNKKSEREFHLVVLIFLRRIYLFMLQQLSPISAAHRVRSCELQDSVIETTQFRARWVLTSNGSTIQLVKQGSYRLKIDTPGPAPNQSDVNDLCTPQLSPLER